MFNFLDKPYPFFLNDENKNLVLIVFTSVFVSVFLILYVPFENSGRSVISNVGWGALSFLMLYLNIILLPKLLPALFDLSQWTLMKFIIFNIWLFFVIGLSFSFINASLYCTGKPYNQVLFKTLQDVLLTGIIPLIVITVAAKNELLRQNLADAVNTNKKLYEIQNLREKVKSQDTKVTLKTDTSETFSFHLTDLVFIVAMDNYSEVYWKEKDEISKNLLRITLKNAEAQLSNQFIVRCHRSYLINVREIDSIHGNANGYKLQMKGIDTQIPVSRAKGKEIIAHIYQIRDLMDII